MILKKIIHTNITLLRTPQSKNTKNQQNIVEDDVIEDQISKTEVGQSFDLKKKNQIEILNVLNRFFLSFGI